MSGRVCIPCADRELGYGRSTATKKAEDYAQENINRGMVALLDHLGRERAVWIGKLSRNQRQMLQELFHR